MQGLLSNSRILNSSIFGAGGGSNIKSIQRGEISFNVVLTSETIAINSVDISNSVVIIRVASTNSGVRLLAVGAKLTSSTEITILRTAASGTTYVEWQVIEFNNVKSKQTGEKTCTTSTANASITAVDLSKSILFYSWTSTATESYTRSLMANARLSATDNIAFRMSYTTDNEIVFYWQVIEFK